MFKHAYAVPWGNSVYLNIALCSFYTLSPHVANKSPSLFSNSISNRKCTVINHLGEEKISPSYSNNVTLSEW